MGEPAIYIDPGEAKRIEKNIILRGIYYRPTGYHPNPKSLRDACKKEGHRFRLSECKDFLENQESYQTNKTSPKYIPRASYGRIIRPTVYTSAIYYFSLMITIKVKNIKQYLTL
jgi:hypothetical protein